MRHGRNKLTGAAGPVAWQRAGHSEREIEAFAALGQTGAGCRGDREGVLGIRPQPGQQPVLLVTRRRVANSHFDEVIQLIIATLQSTVVYLQDAIVQRWAGSRWRPLEPGQPVDILLGPIGASKAHGTKTYFRLGP